MCWRNEKSKKSDKLLQTQSSLHKRYVGGEKRKIQTPEANFTIAETELAERKT